MNLSEIPGYKEAVAQEREARDYAFLDLPREICGFEVGQMTLRQLLVRLAIGCPFFVGGAPSPGDIAAFIWHLSPDYTPQEKRRWFRKSKRQRFIERAAKVEMLDAWVAIRDYIDWTFLDAPPHNGRSGPQYTSIAATLVDLFAAEYGWSQRQIIDSPIVQLYQLVREITHRRNPKATIFNRRSDKVRGEFLRAQTGVAL